VHGRGSHGHNDALSIEVSACGVPFIVDPGTYLYTANLPERHLFRSTAYHSTVQVDGVEQNTTDQSIPFIIGNEAKPQKLFWETDDMDDSAGAEHYGYQRLPQGVTHRRSVSFSKTARYWLIKDQLSGEGAHDFSFRFHFAPGIRAGAWPDGNVEAWDKMESARLLIAPLSEVQKPEFDSGFVSTDYGAKHKSVIVRWSERASVPLVRYWAIVPLRGDKDDTMVSDLIPRLRAEIGTPQNS
jgi:uncharacterized heparinase superfamily protein